MTRILCNAHFHLSRINTLEWDCCVTYVCILKGWQTAFQSGFTISLFHLYCGSIPLLHIPTVVLSVCILWIFHPNGCIVLSSCDLEFTLVVMLNIFSMWVFIICVSSFGKNLFSRLAHLKKTYYPFLTGEFWEFLNVFILDKRSLPNMYFQRLSPHLQIVFSLSQDMFHRPSSFSFEIIYFLVLFLMWFSSEVWSYTLWSRQEDILVFSEKFKRFYFTFKCMVHFSLVL